MVKLQSQDKAATYPQTFICIPLVNSIPPATPPIIVNDEPGRTPISKLNCISAAYTKLPISSPSSARDDHLMRPHLATTRLRRSGRDFGASRSCAALNLRRVRRRHHHAQFRHKIVVWDHPLVVVRVRRPSPLYPRRSDGLMLGLHRLPRAVRRQCGRQVRVRGFAAGGFGMQPAASQDDLRGEDQLPVRGRAHQQRQRSLQRCRHSVHGRPILPSHAHAPSRDSGDPQQTFGVGRVG